MTGMASLARLLVFTAGLELVSCDRRRAWSTGALYVASLALAAFVALAALRFAVTEGSSAAFGYVDTPVRRRSRAASAWQVQYHEDVWARTWSYLYQHAYYGKLLIFPGKLSCDCP